MGGAHTQQRRQKQQMGESVVIPLVASKTVAFWGDLPGETQALQAFELLVQAVDVLISVQQGSFPHPTYCLAPKISFSIPTSFQASIAPRSAGGNRNWGLWSKDENGEPLEPPYPGWRWSTHFGVPTGIVDGLVERLKLL